MDVSLREKVTRSGKSLVTAQNVSEMSDEKNLNNHENTGNHKMSEPVDVISTPKKTVSENEHENEIIEISQSSQQKRGRPRKGEKLVRQSPRVLRSRSQEKPKIPESVDVPSENVKSKEKKRRKMKKINKDQNSEFSKIKSHLRYLLSRMSYEQNFIDAYVGEGWKGQSLEKIRPEKEIERAKSDINRYKLKIRDLFHRIDTSCEEGRIPESLYDSEGLIDSEDIFCSKCGQTEVRLDNDIILCDGACERGFHQFCLEPPLLKEQVPPGDEGWLCPACDCKVDCFELLNDAQATNLSISDNWEKVFPETVASGNNLDDNSGLLSDDSEDDDYNPDAPQVEDEADTEDSSSDDSDSDFSAASEDLGAVANNDQFLGLPSDDSEDDDFNPDKPDSDEEAKEKSSGSDFTSDFDDLRDIKNEGTSAEVQEPVIPENDEEIPDANIEDDDFARITAKRHVERLDYKKLHDETYGDVSSDSSDEEFFDSEAPKKRKNAKGAKDMESNKKLKESESTPTNGTTEKQDVEGTSNPPALKGSSVKNGTKSSSKRLGEAVTQRLYESFKENHYPDQNTREKLVKELNLTNTQIRKWFENARWSFNHPRGRNKTVKSPPKPTEVIVTKQAVKSTPKPAEEVPKPAEEAPKPPEEVPKPAEEVITVTNQSNEANSRTPKFRKKKTKADHLASPMDLSTQTNTRRSSRVQAKKL